MDAYFVCKKLKETSPIFSVIIILAVSMNFNQNILDNKQKTGKQKGRSKQKGREEERKIIVISHSSYKAKSLPSSSIIVILARLGSPSSVLPTGFFNNT